MRTFQSAFFILRYPFGMELMLCTIAKLRLSEYLYTPSGNPKQALAQFDNSRQFFLSPMTGMLKFIRLQKGNKLYKFYKLIH